MYFADKRSYTETLPPAPRRYTCFNWLPVALIRMDKTRRKFFLFLLPICGLFLLVHHHVSQLARGTFSFGSQGTLHAETPFTNAHERVNSTLGFGALVAVSHAKSPRREGLLWSAKLTGIEVTIPTQPQWTDAHLKAFKSDQGSRITRGSALAWMGHLNALRWFLSTDLHTALILEDDVDFSLHLPSQIPPAAHALRTLLSPGAAPPPQNTSSTADPHFWAPPTAWDLLWLGHCTDAASPQHVLSHPSITYPDPHMPPRDALAPPAATLLSALHLSHRRILYRSYWPLCTFAYAVTRASAARILAAYAEEGPAGCVAFDVRLLEACRDHAWRCWSVAPELFHHVPGKSEIAGADADADAGGKDGGDADADAQGDRSGRRKPSVNIECGARNEWLWVDGEDVAGREKMVARVREASARGECFVDRMREGTRVGEEVEREV